jgi:hypothetical protein
MLLTIAACRLTTISAYGSSSWPPAKASPWSPGPRPTIAPERLPEALSHLKGIGEVERER